MIVYPNTFHQSNDLSKTFGDVVWHGPPRNAEGGTVGAMTSRCLRLITLHNVPERNAHELSLILGEPLNYSSSNLAPKSTWPQRKPSPRKADPCHL